MLTRGQTLEIRRHRGNLSGVSVYLQRGDRSGELQPGEGGSRVRRRKGRRSVCDGGLRLERWPIRLRVQGQPPRPGISGGTWVRGDTLGLVLDVLCGPWDLPMQTSPGRATGGSGSWERTWAAEGERFSLPGSMLLEAGGRLRMEAAWGGRGPSPRAGVGGRGLIVGFPEERLVVSRTHQNLGGGCSLQPA